MQHKIMQHRLGVMSLAVLFFGSVAACADWQPDHPITIIVPWSAGGSTDQVTRVIAPILEEELGVKIVVLNQPGASGSIGTAEALAAPRDGYTWTANAIANNATYAVTGLIENTSINDYVIYLHVANAPLVSVNPDTPYQDFASWVEALHSNEVSVGTAGVNSSGGMALAVIKEAIGGEFGARMVTYDGGNPAVMAAVSGEVDATTQLAVEQTEMIKAGRLRPLAVLSETALVVKGMEPVPSIIDFLPDFKISADYFGVFIPVGAPQEVYDKVDEIWQRRIMNSPELQAYASERGAVFSPSYGQDAIDKSMPVVIAEACARVTRNEAVIDPAEIGIVCK